MIKNGQVKLQFCPTEVMIADVLTKPLARDRFQRLTKAVGMVVEPALEGVLNNTSESKQRSSQMYFAAVFD